MIVADQKNEAQLITLIPSIQHHMNEWQLVNINILRDSQLTQEQIIKRMMNTYEKYEGIIYPISHSKIIMLVRFGLVHNYAHMKKDIEKEMPHHCCRITLRKMSAAGLKQIQIDFMERGDSIKFEETMYDQRQQRRNNILLIADDDNFIRSAMKKLLLASGSLVEAGDSSKVIKQYVNYNPDIVFLDIHMPGKNGLDLIRDIIALDPDAYIIILSADSSAENVMKALEEGAIGFLSKPPSKKKVQEYISQCITMR